MSKFEMLTDRDHCRKRPGMYLGSTIQEETERFVNGKWKKTNYVPSRLIKNHPLGPLRGTGRSPEGLRRSPRRSPGAPGGVRKRRQASRGRRRLEKRKQFQRTSILDRSMVRLTNRNSKSLLSSTGRLVPPQIATDGTTDAGHQCYADQSINGK